jgi:hypothetical protein
MSTSILARMRQLIGATSEWTGAGDLVLGDGELACERQADGSVLLKVGNGGGTTYSGTPYVGVGANALRGPSAETMPALPAAVSRANLVLSFDSSGNPVCLAPAGGSATDLALQLSGPTGATMVGWKASGSATVQRTIFQRMSELVYASDYAGYDPSGATSSADMAPVLATADAGARAAGKSLYITGTPRIKSTLTLGAKTRWLFQGAPGAAAGDVPPSYLVKDASLNGTALVLNADGITLENFALVCDAGNGGDGVQIKRNTVCLIGRSYVYRAGRDGIRIGDDAGPSNANGFYLEQPVVQACGRHGINIDDKAPGAPDANAGLIVRPLVQGCTSYGIRFGNANLGNTVLAPIVETCATGLYFDTLSNRNVVVGGDIEANTTANVGYASLGTQYGNRLVQVTVNGVVTNTDHATQPYTPTVIGSTTAGAGTYTTQKGIYTISDGVMIFEAEITWTAHTGAGQLYANLPSPLGTSISGGVSNPPSYIPVFCVLSGIPSGAGLMPVLLVNTTASPPQARLYTYNLSTGALAALALPAAGTLYMSGSVPFNQGA